MCVGGGYLEGFLVAFSVSICGNQLISDLHQEGLEGGIGSIFELLVFVSTQSGYAIVHLLAVLREILLDKKCMGSHKLACRYFFKKVCVLCCVVFVCSVW